MNKSKIAAVAALAGVYALTELCEAAQMALKLDGDPESYFAAPDHQSLDADLGAAFTVEAWVNPAVNVGENIILNKEDAYEIAVKDETFQTAVQPKGVGWEWWNSEEPVPIDTWTHVAITWDGSMIRTFVNGKFLKAFDKAGVLNDSPDTFKVGRRTRGGDTHSIFTGLIDEVRISKVIRYSEDGYTLPKAAFTSDADTAALYHFDEAVNGVVKDASHLGNHGTLIQNAVLVPANTPITSAPPAVKPTIAAARTANGISITFTGTLEFANDVKGPWTGVQGAVSPLSIKTDQSKLFYRARGQ
ncbi:MAG: LamG domain-containing protein [Verrucomicrobia bacterium]|nr:LamG domain-containing protein [Verrucomicrobiota bacterium]